MESTFTNLKVKKLRRHLLARRFAVPKLQRNFVWYPTQAAKLLDSIYHEMPIGSLFLWEMDKKSANLIRQSAEVLPSFNGANGKIWFVIDGQQRLSVIHQAFEGEKKENDAGREIDFGRLCFVVKPNNGEENPARVVYRKPIDRVLVPVSDILASDWKRRMPSKGKGFMRRVTRCRERLLKFPVPIVTVRRATLDEIGEVFIRINSQGMRITSADRAIALMGKLDVRAMAQELRQRVRDAGFKLLSVDPILQGFNLAVEQPRDGGPPKLEAMARRWSKRIEKDELEMKRFRKIWYRYQEAFLTAVDYLRGRFPIYDESYLPSANMIATLAVFFFRHPGQPNARQARELRKWFWATGVADRYSGRGYNRNLVEDAKLFESLARGSRRRFSCRELLDPVVDLQSTEYRSQSARARAFFCLLSAQKPRYLENGEEIDLRNGALSHANKRHRHHIFPKGRLAGRGFRSRVYNSLCNICYLVSRDNQKIGMKMPRKYLAPFRDRNRQRFRRVMKSHLIPVKDEDGVWDRGVSAPFKKFRQQRLRLICAKFEEQAGIKLFRRGQ